MTRRDGCPETRDCPGLDDEIRAPKTGRHQGAKIVAVRARTAETGSSLPVVGRDAETFVLMGLLDEVRAGSGRQVVIEGEPGIGKTRLAAEIIDRAAGFTVLGATGEELQRDRPFGLLVDALDVDGDETREDRRTIAELLRASADVSPDHRYLIVDAIEDAFEREGMQRPVVCVLEDVHWADPGSILAVASHLRSVFRKVGVSSRTELVAEATRHLR